MATNLVPRSVRREIPQKEICLFLDVVLYPRAARLQLSLFSVTAVAIVVGGNDSDLLSSELETLAFFGSPPDTCIPYFGTVSEDERQK